MRNARAFVKSIAPTFAIRAYRRFVIGQMQRRNRARSVEDVFTEIYARNLWGGAAGSFCSGTGSRAPQITTGYLQTVKRELERLDGASLTAVDLGCGDFAIGRELTPAVRRYVGVDVVGALIAHNNREFASDSVSFVKLDIVRDELPDGEICFLRQVLQHLSNDEILRVLPKLAKYHWCFITEHQPTPRLLRVPNADKAHGADIRVLEGSGVFLDLPPFSVDVRRLRLLLEVSGADVSNGNGNAMDVDPGIIRTYLLTSDRGYGHY